MTMADKRNNGCAAALLPIFAGFFLGGVLCFLICLCGGCHSQKSVTTSVAVDSAAMSATTEIGVANSEATSMKNLSLHFDPISLTLGLFHRRPTPMGMQPPRRRLRAHQHRWEYLAPALGCLST